MAEPRPLSTTPSGVTWSPGPTAQGLTSVAMRGRAGTVLLRTYPDAVTLARGTVIPELLSGVDATIGCSVKDSFAELDLTPYGFRTLFEADWVVRLGPPLPAPSGGAGGSVLPGPSSW